ncbi:MAG: hypothetical protein KKF44_03150 [Nanoarchaeota archaeon]|nr:hypothetical protein [Nanoarchaeota archaeon]
MTSVTKNSIDALEKILNRNLSDDERYYDILSILYESPDDFNSALDAISKKTDKEQRYDQLDKILFLQAALAQPDQDFMLSFAENLAQSDDYNTASEHTVSAIEYSFENSTRLTPNIVSDIFNGEVSLKIASITETRLKIRDRTWHEYKASSLDYVAHLGPGNYHILNPYGTEIIIPQPTKTKPFTTRPRVAVERMPILRQSELFKAVEIPPEEDFSFDHWGAVLGRDVKIYDSKNREDVRRINMPTYDNAVLED